MNLNGVVLLMEHSLAEKTLIDAEFFKNQSGNIVSEIIKDNATMLFLQILGVKVTYLRFLCLG